MKSKEKFLIVFLILIGNRFYAMQISLNHENCNKQIFELTNNLNEYTTKNSELHEENRKLNKQILDLNNSLLESNKKALQAVQEIIVQSETSYNVLKNSYDTTSKDLADLLYQTNQEKIEINSKNIQLSQTKEDLKKEIESLEKEKNQLNKVLEENNQSFEKDIVRLKKDEKTIKNLKLIISLSLLYAFFASYLLYVNRKMIKLYPL